MSTSPTGTPGQSSAGIPVSAVAGWLNLRSPTKPGQRPPRRLRKVLPDPLASLEQFERYVGRDVAGMAREQRAHERSRLLAAAAAVEYDDVPMWLWARLALLQGGR